MCIFEKPILNRKYVKNKKNRGQPPPISDLRLKYVQSTCGECIECRKEKARDWQVRLLEDIKYHTNAKYVVLTFSNESIAKLHEEYIEKLHEDGRRIKVPIKELNGYEKDNAIATRAIHLFRENWRKQFKKSIRHWLVTELGHNGTENIHLHGFLWVDKKVTSYKGRGKKKQIIEETAYDAIRRVWSYGYIYPRKHNEKEVYVNARTINYNIKYVHKIDKQHKAYKSRIFSSAGIGLGYITSGAYKENKYKGKDTKETYRTSTGHQISMPKYWRDKIYTEQEKERLWIMKMNKETKYICGEKVSTKNGMNEYDKLKEEYVKKNRQLGYGGEPISNERKHYENERRNIIINTRITNANK